MKTETILHIKGVENKIDRLAELSDFDKKYVLGHLVALETAGISPDANREKKILERLIMMFAHQMAYCRHVEQCYDGVSTYEEWVNETYDR